MQHESQPYRGARRSIPNCTSIILSVTREGYETENQVQSKSQSEYDLREPMLMGVVSTKIERTTNGLKIGSPKNTILDPSIAQRIMNQRARCFA